MNVLGVQHVGITVSSLEKTLAFYRDCFGIEPVFVLDDLEGADLDGAIGVEGVRLKLAFLPLGNIFVELIEYASPEGADFTARPCDVGSSHVAVHVDDIQAAYKRMIDLGVRFNAPPVVIDEDGGMLAGIAFAYCQDPDGITVELFQPTPALQGRLNG